MHDAIALADTIRRGERRAGEVCEQALARTADDELGCFWRPDPERALARAHAVDGLVDRGIDPGVLAGVPVAVKDCFDVEGLPGTSGVAVADPLPAAVDATAVARLRDAGAVIIGKTAMHQLAWGMSGQAPGFPTCRNPSDPERMPGGSSSGSAAAVAAGIVPLGLGTDSGGSVRVPAAWCGIVGLKPTYAAVPIDGCAPMAASLDTVGPLARSVRDCQAVLAVLCGESVGPLEPVTAPKVGVLESGFADVDPGVADVCRKTLDAWQESGATLRPVKLAWERRGLGKLYAAELACVWGQLLDRSPELLAREVRAGIGAGRRVLAVDYLEALASLERLRAESLAKFADLNVIACPTVPIVAPPLVNPDPVAVAGRNARIFSGLRWPAISIPCGTVGGLPVGIQLAARPGHDAELLEIAARLEHVLR